MSKKNQSQAVVKAATADCVQELLQQGKENLRIELGSIPTSRDLEPKIRVGVSTYEITRRKYQLRGQSG